MKTVTLQLYQYSELSEQAKASVLADHRLINVFDDWWQSIYEDFIDIADSIGISVDINKVYFNGFYSQSDGSAFVAKIDIGNLILCITKRIQNDCISERDLNLSLPNVNNHVLRLLINREIDCTGEIKTSSRGQTVQANFILFAQNLHFYDNINREIENLEPWLQEIADNLNAFLFKNLQSEFEYLTSDNAIIETIEANDYHFTSDGVIANRIEKLTK